MIRRAPATAGQHRRDARATKPHRTAERQQRTGSPCQWIYDGEIAGPVSTEKGASGIEEVQCSGCQQEQRPARRPRLDHESDQNPDGDGRKEQRFNRRRKPDEVFAVSSPLGQEIPRRVRESGKYDKKERGK